MPRSPVLKVASSVRRVAVGAIFVMGWDVDEFQARVSREGGFLTRAVFTPDVVPGDEWKGPPRERELPIHGRWSN